VGRRATCAQRAITRCAHCARCAFEKKFLRAARFFSRQSAQMRRTPRAAHRWCIVSALVAPPRAQLERTSDRADFRAARRRAATAMTQANTWPMTASRVGAQGHRAQADSAVVAS
jgi:hypothetical protein